MNPSNTAASWRGVQITDPPASFAHVTLLLGVGRSRKYHGSTDFDVQEQEGKGVTLGDIIDAGSETKHNSNVVSKATAAQLPGRDHQAESHKSRRA